MTIDISPEAVEHLWRFWANKAQALADENKALSAALTASQAETAAAWQPIETAPRDGSRFLAYENRDVSYYPCWWRNDYLIWEGWQDDWDSEPDPSHWQPLPPPPKGKGQ
jgi:hypothetical protein